MASNKGRRSNKKGVSERIEDWDVKESTVERLLDILIALIAMFIILCLSLITFSVRQHILTIILVPLLVYFTLSFSGMRLRLRERASWLILTDILAIINVIALCLYMDTVYVNQESDWVVKMAFSIAGIIPFLLYLTRVKAMYYLTVPAVLIINIVLGWAWGFSMGHVLLVALILPLPYALIIISHPFYFGIGRVLIYGKYQNHPEQIAKRIRTQQKADRDAEDRRIRADEKARKAERKDARKKA